MLRTCTRSCRPGQRPLVVEMILSIPEEPTVGCDLNFKVKLWEKKKKKKRLLSLWDDLSPFNRQFLPHYIEKSMDHTLYIQEQSRS